MSEYFIMHGRLYLHKISAGKLVWTNRKQNALLLDYKKAKEIQQQSELSPAVFHEQYL